MSRRLVNLTLDTLEELPKKCRSCVYWELDPIAAERACVDGTADLAKESWVSQTLLEWGSCGKLAYAEGMPAGFVMYAPPSYMPRSSAFPTSPISADAVLLATAHVVPAFSGAGIGRMLIQGVARDLAKRGVKAIEAFGDTKLDEPSCVVPADFYLSVGFKTVRQHPRYPRLRLEIRTALGWKSDVEYALEKLFNTMSPDQALSPAKSEAIVS
ncbi:MAG: GNAT family N-acetyltransferase [Longispora sp.]|nr:GNAT family N-acetyltransferase [Longispora sp. (in: high G+C Gram-positive bacteria)]